MLQRVGCGFVVELSARTKHWFKDMNKTIFLEKTDAANLYTSGNYPLITKIME